MSELSLDFLDETLDKYEAKGKKKAINQLLEKSLEEMDTAYPRLLISYSGTDEILREKGFGW